ncbi:MAG: chemotaxis response regulator protein-glutamate methylesterase [Gammaproteobacteria bacterium]|nr:MAG: chemotaxis response regulator protein-glutamate methylesterase [Gammaproteobacteria bacterium]RLA23909.1 MAG: chemotaxis response regulator protein-glutamate methylesterase [Gammaproteobacteria bacterium]
MDKIKLLIVDDSALVRKLLTEIFSETSDIEVIGTAPDAYIAREKIKKLNPDVLTLDVEMPRMDGVTFLKNLMRLRPMPVVMVSTLTQQGADTTLKALEYGAVNFVAKPKADLSNSLAAYADEIVEKVRDASKASVKAIELVASQPKPVRPRVTLQRPIKHSDQRPMGLSDRLIVLGASTGGTEAIKAVVSGLPASTPAMVISQHLPAAFSESFAKHVDEASEMTALIPQEGEVIKSGHIYIAPGDRHMEIVRSGNQFICHLLDGPVVNRHKPSVEVMFKSVIQNVGKRAIGVMLTGMGADGSQSLKDMQDNGSPVIIQDEASSVVWGMPGEAHKLGCRDHVVPLDKVAAKILSLV